MSLPPKRGVTLVVGAGASISAGGPSVHDITQAVLAMESPRIIGDLSAYYVADPTTGYAVPASGYAGPPPTAPTVSIVAEALRATYNTFNFETILHAVETLEPYSASRTLVDELKRVRPVITAYTDPTPRYAALFNYVMLHRLRWTTIETIRNLVVKRIHSHDAAIGSKTNAFLERLRSRFTLTVINLNYDDLWERGIEWSDGFSHSHAGLFSAFDRVRFVTEVFSNHTLMHLHGSVRFGYPTTSAAFTHPIRQLVKYEDVEEAAKSLSHEPAPSYIDDTIDDAVPLVSGANKSLKFTSLPYSYYYSALLQAAQRNDRILFVGYGFMDAHVNRVAIQSLEHHQDKNCRVAIIDFRPAKSGEWTLLSNATFRELTERLTFGPFPLDSGPDVEFTKNNRLGVSGVGFPARPDITEKIADFLDAP